MVFLTSMKSVANVADSLLSTDPMARPEQDSVMLQDMSMSKEPEIWSLSVSVPILGAPLGHSPAIHGDPLQSCQVSIAFGGCTSMSLFGCISSLALVRS